MNNSHTQPIDEAQRERLTYTYTYTSDDESAENPQSNTLKVITTVEEETTPDGMKVLRKKEQSQQISKVTKVEKITRVLHNVIDPTSGEHIREDDPRYQKLIEQLSMKSGRSEGFVPSTKFIRDTMKRLDLEGKAAGFNGNEPENNKSTANERSASLISFF